MIYRPYQRTALATSSPTISHVEDLTLEDNLRFDSRVESESWLLSYIDVFLLIIAFLVIILFKSPVRTSTSDEIQPVPVTHLTITETLKSLTNDHRITVTSNTKHISVRLDNTLLFDSSKANIRPSGREAIRQLIPALKELNRPIIIEGHTDNTPINTPLYPSNWELSAARANSVLHYLDSQGIPKEQMSTANYADTRPLAPNNSSDNRSMNRRVNLLILIEGDARNSDFEL